MANFREKMDRPSGKNKITPSIKSKRTILILVLIILLVTSYLVGFLIGSQQLKFERGFISRLIHQEKPSFLKDIDFNLFWEVWKRIEEKYPGTIDRQKMLEGAILGMVKALGDPYTVYMTSEEAKEFFAEMEGTFEGIGAEIGIKDNKLTIISVLKDTPAYRSGLKSRDVILKIGDEETGEMSVDEAVSKIRGKAGTEVFLTISRKGKREPLEFKITRETIKIESVSFEAKGKIAYLKINHFSENTTTEFQKIEKEILAKNPSGIILDLRDNPGGYLQAVVDISSEFISEGVITIEEEKGGKKNYYNAKGGGSFTTLPLVVLINGGSASGSEILAGAILDHRRGVLIGERSFGKGLVQDLEEIDGRILKLTIAYWLTPSGKMISSQGLSPTFEVKMTEEDYKTGRDPQLDRALEYLKSRQYQ